MECTRAPRLSSSLTQSIDAVTKDMGGYAEKIKERDQIIAKQRGEMGRAADALRDSSEQRKDLIARPEKAERRAQAMAGLCRKLKVRRCGTRARARSTGTGRRR